MIPLLPGLRTRYTRKASPSRSTSHGCVLQALGANRTISVTPSTGSPRQISPTGFRLLRNRSLRNFWPPAG